MPAIQWVTEPTRLDRGVNRTPHSRPESEADDVARAVAGDTAAFERLYRTHVPRILALSRRMAGADAADELTQDVFVRAWQKLGSFRGESSLATWLHRMAVNVIIERFRALGTQRDRFLPDGDEALSPDVDPGLIRPRLGRGHGPRSRQSTGCRRGPDPSSCSTTSKATSTRRSARCSACRSAPRSRNCTARG